MAKMLVGEPPEKINTGVYPGTCIGRALFGLTSVLDISVFKAKVKSLTNQRREFIIGELVGNVKVELISRGQTGPESDVKNRPE